MEAAYSDYYGYPYYWRSLLLWGAGASPDQTAPQTPAMLRMVTAAAAAAMVSVVLPEVHLHSTKEVATYHIAATDGLIGYVNDFIVDDTTWAIRYLVIDTHTWFLGKAVLIAPRWITSINWAQGEVHTKLSREAIRQSPAYDNTNLLSREYETQLHQHYGQSAYWPDNYNGK